MKPVLKDYVIGAENRLIYSAELYTTQEREILLAQVKAQTPDDVVHRFWSDRAFAPLSARVGERVSSEASRQSHPQGGA